MLCIEHLANSIYSYMHKHLHAFDHHAAGFHNKNKLFSPTYSSWNNNKKIIIIGFTGTKSHVPWGWFPVYSTQIYIFFLLVCYGIISPLVFPCTAHKTTRLWLVVCSVSQRVSSSSIKSLESTQVYWKPSLFIIHHVLS